MDVSTIMHYLSTNKSEKTNHEIFVNYVLLGGLLVIQWTLPCSGVSGLLRVGRFKLSGNVPIKVLLMTKRAIVFVLHDSFEKKGGFIIIL